MFLDGRLRAIAAAKQGIILRNALFRRLAGIEVLSARIALRHALATATMGLTLVGQLFEWLRKR